VFQLQINIKSNLLKFKEISVFFKSILEKGVFQNFGAEWLPPLGIKGPGEGLPKF
jgi:hypothetical protein